MWMGVVLVVVLTLQQQLLVLAAVLPDIVISVAVGIVLWGLGDSFPVWQVVLRYLQIVVCISGGGIPWCCR